MLLEKRPRWEPFEVVELCAIDPLRVTVVDEALHSRREQGPKAEKGSNQSIAEMLGGDVTTVSVVLKIIDCGDGQ